MKDLVLYIHGKGGSAAESEHYKPLFPDCEVLGLDYQTFTPWETGAEIRAAAENLKAEYERIILIANSIGAFFSMNAGIDKLINKAYFISPIVDMEKLIVDMMLWANVTEDMTPLAITLPSRISIISEWQLCSYRAEDEYASDFDEGMVRRLIERITIYDDHLAFEFKCDLETEVQR